jgi:phage tail-like protein
VTNETGLLEWVKANAATPTDMSVVLYDSEGEVVRSWKFANAYPVKWTGPDVNAGGNTVMTESLEIAHNGISKG